MSENFLYGNGTNRLYGVSDTIDSDSSLTVASTKCVNNVYNNLKELIDSKGGGLPLGHIYLWPFSTPPDGSIQLNSSTYSRELYSDLWTLIQTKGWYKPESEWQQIASANGGYCPWYSDGDGSTTFRTPKFAPYQKIALASGDSGKYYKAGLPDHDHDITTYGELVTAGAEWGLRWTNTRASKTGKASASNSIYGNSTTVQPESHDWIVCAVAFGTATNVGSVDVANVMSAVSQVQANPSFQSKAHIIETWKSTEYTTWYRKWSDGFIEQGGSSTVIGKATITLPTPFYTSNFTVVSGGGNGNLGNWNSCGIVSTTQIYLSTSGTDNFTGPSWYYACGY